MIALTSERTAWFAFSQHAAKAWAETMFFAAHGNYAAAAGRGASLDACIAIYSTAAVRWW